MNADIDKMVLWSTIVCLVLETRPASIPDPLLNTDHDTGKLEKARIPCSQAKNPEWRVGLGQASKEVM